jgi:hypothetical protein
VCPPNTPEAVLKVRTESLDLLVTIDEWGSAPGMTGERRARMGRWGMSATPKRDAVVAWLASDRRGPIQWPVGLGVLRISARSSAASCRVMWRRLLLTPLESALVPVTAALDA